MRPMLRLAPVVAALALALALGAGAAVAAPVAPASPAEAAVPAGPVSWVVGLRDGMASHELRTDLRRAGAEVEPLRRLDALVVDGGTRAEVVGVLRRADRVAYVEPQLLRRLHGDPAGTTDPSTGRAFDWAFDAVRASGGLAAAGGGAPGAPVAVVDSGVDTTHPDLAGRVLGGHDVLGHGSVEDRVGHGTFIAGLVSAIDGNGAGGRGVAGSTPVIPVRISLGTSVTSADLAAGIVAAADRGAKVINVSVGGPSMSQVERDALDYAAARDVLVVASAGNSAQRGNAPEFPAAAIGGDLGGWGPGLSVGATDPLDRPAPFSTHNRNVSIAAPGAGAGPCTEGVYSAIPLRDASLWAGGPCDRVFPDPAHGPGRYAYGEGTSFAAPLVAGGAALVRQVGPGLRADQVAHVLRRTARQAGGGGWNEHTGAGVLDITGAVALARRYDLTPPGLVLTTSQGPGALHVHASSEDATAAGAELAGSSGTALDYSRDGSGFSPLLPATPGSIDRSYAVSPAQPLWIRASACDANGNCVSRTAGPFTGAASPAAPAAPSTAGPRPRPRARILGVGAGRCAPGGRRCVRVAWRASDPGTGGLRFVAELRRPGARGVLARTSGRATAGRRLVVTLRPRRALRCGRAVVRLTVRTAAGADTRVRHVVVRRPCARGGRAR